MTNERKKMLLGLAFVLPSFAMIMGIVAYPILQSVVLSFQTPGGEFSVEHYVHLMTDSMWQSNFTHTMYVVIMTTILNTVISYAFACYLIFSKGKTAGILGKLYIIPRFIPGIVAVYAMLQFFSNTGAINRFFLQFGWNLRPEIVHTATGLIVANLWFNIPFATMLITSGLADIPKSVIESARDVGAGRLRVFTHVIFPLSYKAMLISATFVFMGNVGSFVTPFLMGASAPRMLGVALFNEFRQFHNINRAAALSVIMFVICAIVGLGYIITSLREAEWEK
jgi:ABC-type spermidine/putrescine transport system permease subunit I